MGRLVRRVDRRLKALAPAPRGAPTGVPLTMVAGGAGMYRNLWYAPGAGVAFDDAGQVFASLARPVSSLGADLSRLPHVTPREAVNLFTAPTNAPEIARGTLFADGRGLRNYARFLLANLPAVLSLDAPALMPPPTRWQADLLDLIGVMPLVVDAPLVRVGEALLPPEPGFPAAIDPRVLEIRDRVAARVEAWSERERVYLSGYHAARAVMTDEAAFEWALAQRGFVIIRPETLTVRQLVGVLRGARLVVSASGTALAHLLFCAPGARVVEIQPPGTSSAWGRILAELIGAEWHGFSASGPRAVIDTPLDPSPRPDTAFSWSVDEAFLPFLDALAPP
ncbi:glycosyltransferase 61 family protein [uncultured Caulobacter sp.]|uniref:glycosyltransferase family 61 protein n=1 Tax=uncultured Caulobacter sp. TaxID=158749 RepID=UPI0026113316|nr:glycosyltransferase 61 family protein [uncultured Caulobacter sp.]